MGTYAVYSIQTINVKCLDWDLAQIHQTVLLLLLFCFKLSALHSVITSRESAQFCALTFVLEIL